MVTRESSTVAHWRWAGLFSVAVGLFFVIMGAVTLVGAGLSEPIDEPVIEVLGFGHTAVLGFIELAVGFVLVVAGASTAGSTVEAFVGMLLVVGGILGWADSGEVSATLGLENSYCVLAIVLGAAVTLVSILTPGESTARYSRSRRHLAA
jgi:hypothetical protein